MSRTDELYTELTRLLREAALLSSCGSVLSWDEQTYMPKNGSAHRAEQLGLLAGLAHERSTAPRIGELLSELERSGELGEADGDRAWNGSLPHC
jgi:carboxypeptidase Taq